MLLWLCFRMRNRLSTAVKGGWSQKNMERAVEDVLKACLPVKSAAEKHQVSRTSLRLDWMQFVEEIVLKVKLILNHR